MDVETEITALYALPLEEFVSARNTLAKQAKGDARAEVAAGIKALRKPTTVAWLANQLARSEADAVDQLIGLGEQMREATSERDGARLRELTAQRKDVVDALLRSAATLARDAGYGMTDDVTAALSDTFHAALADPEAGVELRAGRLSRPLENVGFGPVTEGEAAEVISLSRARSARERRQAGTPAAAPADRADAAAGRRARGDSRREGGDTEADAEPEKAARRRRDEAESELDAAQAAVTEADDHVDDLTTVLERRREAMQNAESEVERLSAELEASRSRLDEARDAVDTTQDALDRAQEDAESARRRRREAKQLLAEADD